jgi:chromosomal replication initiator protein
MSLAVTNSYVSYDAWHDLLKKHFCGSIYDDWLCQLAFIKFDQGILVLGAPSRFVKDWVETHYGDLISALLCTRIENCTAIKWEIADHLTSAPAPEIETVSVNNEEEGDIVSATLDDRFTFEQFVVGPPNEFAYAAAKRVSESNQAVYNPLFLYGPVGHGKTHLMHSIAHAIKEKDKSKKILYLSAEKFMYHFVRSLRYKNMMAFKERFRSVDVLMIDDVQFISGKESTQEEFFHTFNALVDMRRQVVISADKSPSDLEGIQQRMRSRLGWGLAADLHPTTYELRLGILQSKANRQSATISKDILDFLASHIDSSVRELEGALIRVLAHASLIGKELTLDSVQSILKDLLRPYQKALTLNDIEKLICDYYRMRITDLHSAKRTRAIVRPRQIAMFLAKQLTTSSLPTIGRHFGNRDHTTVMHAVSTIENLLKRDPSVQEDVDALRKSMENR